MGLTQSATSATTAARRRAHSIHGVTRALRRHKPDLLVFAVEPAESAVLAQPRVKKLLSVDGTLIETWTSMKRFKLRDGSAEAPDGGGRSATKRLS